MRASFGFSYAATSIARDRALPTTFCAALGFVLCECLLKAFAIHPEQARR